MDFHLHYLSIETLPEVSPAAVGARTTVMVQLPFEGTAGVPLSVSEKDGLVVIG